MSETYSSFALKADVGMRTHKILAIFEGESGYDEDDIESETTTVGEIRQRWACGITSLMNLEDYSQVFEARGAYANALLKAVIPAATNAPSDSKGHAPGAYVVIATGAGTPEAFRFLGPVPPQSLELLRNPKVLETVATLLMSTPMTTDSVQAPRLVAELDTVEEVFGHVQFSRCSDVISPAKFEQLIAIGETALDFIDEDEAASTQDSERAQTKLALLRAKRQLALAVAALGLG